MAYSNIHKYYYSFSIPIFLVVVVSFIADFVGLLIFVFCINVFIWLESVVILVLIALAVGHRAYHVYRVLFSVFYCVIRQKAVVEKRRD